MAQFRVGLTGGIGSGKSTAADRLAALGAVVIDADVLARQVVAPGSPGLAAVAARFGADLITATGELDRAALGRLVFADPAARADLEQIVHPLVRVAARREVTAAPDDVVVVQVIPLLVETGQAGDFDVVVVVDLDPATQLDRLLGRGMSSDDAKRRMTAQATREDRLAAADVVLDNSGSRLALLDQVDRCWAEWQRRPAG